MVRTNYFRAVGTVAALVLAAVLLALVGLRAEPAQAQSSNQGETECVGLLTGVHENVVVPPGAFCFAVDAQVNGNVKALENSEVQFAGGNTIRGNVQGDKALVVSLFFFPGSSPGGSANIIGGNLEAKMSSPANNSGVFISCGTVLTQGNIQVEKLHAALISIGGPTCEGIGGGNTLHKGTIKVEDNVVEAEMSIWQNRVAQNLQVFKNTGPGDKTVQFNRVAENLQCFENAEPFLGGPNFAQKREGQCF